MYLYIKRFFDVIVASIVLVLLLPVFIPVMILLRLTGEGEIFYRQERMGYKNSRFQIWKFATMLKNSPNIGTGDVTLRNDPRVTWMGRFLRMSKINELPQVLNILSGDMSIVGPRPLMPAGFFRYSQELQAAVYNVKPGLTGIGSIVFRDEEKIITDSGLPPHECYEKIILPLKGALEIWYQKNISFFTDIKIIFLTAWAILFPTTELHYKWLKELPAKPTAPSKA
jgi:lipopolysaccharide/colanic/teichoic acid biosynthesis glycosyltransferase